MLNWMPFKSSRLICKTIEYIIRMLRKNTRGVQNWGTQPDRRKILLFDCGREQKKILDANNKNDLIDKTDRGPNTKSDAIESQSNTSSESCETMGRRPRSGHSTQSDLYFYCLIAIKNKWIAGRRLKDMNDRRQNTKGQELLDKRQSRSTWSKARLETKEGRPWKQKEQSSKQEAAEIIQSKVKGRKKRSACQNRMRMPQNGWEGSGSVENAECRVLWKFNQSAEFTNKCPREFHKM